MRELKFRAWLDYMDDSACMEYFTLVNRVKQYCEEGAFVMQYTGLKDKNGKEIYEGDIIRIVNNKKTHTKVLIEVVSWNNEQSGFWPFTTRIKSLFDNLNKNSCEVVGNIHENPELIKE